MKCIKESKKGNDTFMKLLISTQVLFINISLACSPLKSATVTTEQAILESDSIVLATVVDQKLNTDEILFEVDELIYGKATREHLTFIGRIVDKSLNNKGAIPYKEGRRRTPGSCNANDYERGSTYLIMLKDSKFWTVYRPTNEKINGKNDPWLMWVKGFIAGSKINT